MIRILLTCLGCLLFGPCLGQTQKSNFLDLGLSFGTNQGSLSGAYIHKWVLGEKQRFEVGVGGRFTAYLASNQYYSTAPSQLTKGSSGPGTLFKETITANVDTFLIASPQVFALNALIHLGYRITNKFSAGFNVDVIGFSFGGEQRGNYINGFQGQNTSGKPTSFNILLIGDNDIGSLNSEFYAKYRLSERWSIRMGLQHLFTEYVTNTKVQQFPEPNDRFRNKSTLFMIGASITLK